VKYFSKINSWVMRLILGFFVLFFGVPLPGYPALVSRAPSNLCDANQLPAYIQNRLKTDFGSWKVQTSEYLSPHAWSSWEAKKGTGCPGISAGFLKSAQQVSYAVLLVPCSQPDAGYRFVVFNPQPENSVYEELIVEKSDIHGASNFFIQKVSASKFFDVASKEKFQVQATEAILMVDSAENEYEADIFFWSRDRYRQEPVDY
jgi:hypothetical protein